MKLGYKLGMRSRGGEHRHRQPWIRVTCPHCGIVAAARRTGPGKPMYLRTHFNDDNVLCPPLRLGEARLVYDTTPDPDQMALELG